MAYKKFESRSSRKGIATIALRPDGRLRLNSDATIQARNLGMKRVHLFWDKERRRIALKRASDGDSTAYKLTFSAGQNSTDIGAKAFLKYVGLDLKKKLDVQLDWSDEEKMFEAKLPKGIRLKDTGL